MPFYKKFLSVIIALENNKKRKIDIMNSPKTAFADAKYIKAQEKPSDFSLFDPAPLFRKEFSAGFAKEAKIFVQSPGFARYFINGTDITEDLFISAISNYQKILWYNEYDVTKLIKPGVNTLCVIAGNGFLNESFESAWHYPRAVWRDAPQFLLHLVIDGKTALVSDKSWKCSRDSHIIFNHIRSGEYWDMRLKNDAPFLSGYDDSHWQEAFEKEIPATARLRPTLCQPVREVESFAPKSIKKTEKGYLFDFGVTMSGYLSVNLTEPRGTEIIFKYTEDLYEDNTPKYNEMNKPYYYPESPFHLNKMIASGSPDSFKPMFSYHGFRYVIIEGLTKEPKPEDVKAHFIHQDISRRSSFESGSEILNFIYDAGIRSTYSNLFWCLTDCPTREKLGWANDAQNSVEQTLINFDILPLYEKWFEDLKSEMREDGSIPGVIPSPNWGYNWGPVCDNLLYDLPYTVYLYTGKSDMLTGSIEYFERYLDYLLKKVNEDHEFILGDWMGYKSNEAVPKEFVRDFYLLKSLKTTCFAYSLSGKENSQWAEEYEKRKAAFMEKYIDQEGKCTANAQTSVSMLIVAGLYLNKKPLEDQLVELTEKAMGQCLQCGMVGIQYLYDALCLCGRADLAFKSLTQSDPGYKSWYELGSTTLWERWDGFTYGSRNHHMYSGVISRFYKYFLGIAPTKAAPAFKKLELNPCFVKDIGFIKGEMQTVKGKIKAGWEYKNGGFEYTVTLPEKIKASFMGKELSVGETRFFVKEV